MNGTILRVVAWETTRRCHLNCSHCRGAARDTEYSGELNTAEGKRLIDGIAAFAKPILILTGGEPMSRDDIYELAHYAADQGLKPVMAPCGHLINPETAAKIKAAGINRISISLDGCDAESHDGFRGVPGAFDGSLQGIKYAQEAGIGFQVNTTVTKMNAGQLPDILALAEKLGAGAMDFFFLVPTGRGSELKDLALSPEEYEKTLKWVGQAADTAAITVTTTCAPHYARIVQQAKKGKPRSEKPAGGHPGGPAGHGHGRPRGCMGGRGFVFVSHQGILQPCGFLDIPCGDVRKGDFNFQKIYEESAVFNDLRNIDGYHGKCGICEYRRICGGCRARAYADTDDYLDPEPSCAYEPQTRKT